MRTELHQNKCRNLPPVGGWCLLRRLPRVLAHAVIGIIALPVSLPQAWSQQPVMVRQVNVSTQTGDELPAPQPLPSPGPKNGLSLVDLEQMALQSNPSITQLAALIGAARGRWVQVGLQPNPSVGYQGQQLGSGGRAEQHGVAFNQEIVRSGKLTLNRAVADRDIARAQQQLAAQEQRVLTDVRVAFYQALVAQRQIDVTTELVRMSQQGLDAANARLRATEGSKVEVLQAQVEAATANLFSQKAQSRHQAVWQELSAIVGASEFPPQPLVGDAFAGPKQFDFREVLAQLQTFSPEVAIAVVNIERAQLALQRTQVETRPNISFQGLMNIRDNGINGKSDGGVYAAVPLPLWNKNQGAILEAQHQVAAAQQALSHLELSLQHRLAPVYERYINARNQTEIYRTNILPAAQQSLDLTRQLYAAGEISYINLLTVQRTFSQTNLDYLDALRELRTTEVQIDGLLLSGSFQVQ